jgi:hypothetical protein
MPTISRLLVFLLVLITNGAFAKQDIVVTSPYKKNHNIKPTMSFLPAGDYMAEIYRDGPDADKQPNQLVKIKQKR